MRYLAVALITITALVIDFLSDLWITSAKMRNGWDVTATVITIAAMIYFIATQE